MVSAFQGSIAVVGAAGQLGRDVVRILLEQGHDAVVAFDRRQLDVTDPASVAATLEGGGYAVVVNCAALTNVDLCEEQGELALDVNAKGAYLVARACHRSGARHVLVSTDFVFAGDKGSPYQEEDIPAPVNIYGASKLSGEMLARLAAPDSLVVRISSVFGRHGSRGKGGNFVEAILKQAREGKPLKVVDDVFMSPTYTVDVARLLPSLLHSGASGIVHASNSGRCSWLQFADAVLEIAGLDVEVEPVSISSMPRPARRPLDSTLSSSVLPRLTGSAMRGWREALHEYMTEKGHAPEAGGGSSRKAEQEEAS